MKTAHGSYTGNGTSQSIIGCGFQPDMVWVWPDSATAGVRFSWTSSSMGANKTASFVGAVANFTGGITSLDTDGFSVGSANDCNENTKTMRWIAFKDDDNTFSFGTYSGTGIDDKPITGVGFQPDMVFVKGDTTARGRWRTSSVVGDPCLATENLANSSCGNQIQSLDSDGFTVGTDSTVNTNTINYYWFAFKNKANQFKVGTYTTDASPSDDRSVTGVGFQPIMVFIKGDAAVNGAVRLPDNSGDQSFPGFAGASSANVIQAFESDGFQLGTNSAVQTASKTWYYAAWNNGIPSTGTHIFGDQELIS